MQTQITRRPIAMAYTLLMGLATTEVVLQAFLFSGFYAKGRIGFLDVHEWRERSPGSLSCS